MSGAKERERRRQQRLAAESQAASGERRTKILQLAAGAVFLALAAVVVVIVIAASGGDGGDTELEGVAAVNAELRGVPQAGMVIGDPKAPVELVEFGDLQCPVCAGFAEEMLPPVIAGPVADGRAKLAFRNFTIIDELSLPAGAAALAAGAQGRGWNYLDVFYANQGPEGSGYADDEFLTAVAKAAGVKDVASWNRERESAKLTGEVEKTTAEARRLGFQGTPSFAIEGPGTKGLEPIGTPSSPEEFEAAIEEAAG